MALFKLEEYEEWNPHITIELENGVHVVKVYTFTDYPHVVSSISIDEMLTDDNMHHRYKSITIDFGPFDDLSPLFYLNDIIYNVVNITNKAITDKATVDDGILDYFKKIVSMAMFDK